MPLYGVKRLTEAGVIGEMLYQLDEAQKAAWYADLVFRAESTDPSGENHAWLEGVGGMKEETGDPQFDRLGVGGIRLLNKKWQCGVEIHIDDWNSAKVGMIQKKIEEQVIPVAGHPARLLQSLLANGATTVCYDGQYFFDTDHTGVDLNGAALTNQSNSISYTCTSTRAPTITEVQDAIYKAISQIHSFYDDKGNIVNSEGMKFKVLYPTALERLVSGALHSQLLSTSQITNPLKQAIIDGRLSIAEQVAPYWKGTDQSSHDGICLAVAVSKPANQASAFIHQVYTAPVPQVLGAQSEYCALHNHLLFKQRGVYQLGYGRWQDIVLVTFA